MLKFKNKLLKQHLEEKELSYKAFGELVGVSEPMISHLVNGFKQPSASLLSRIAKEMGVSMEALMEE